MSENTTLSDSDGALVQLITIITLVNLIPTCLLTFYKLRSKFCPRSKEAEPVPAKLSKRTRDRIHKIHLNVEALIEQAGLEKASTS